jgi:hypothetical protein
VQLEESDAPLADYSGRDAEWFLEWQPDLAEYDPFYAEHRVTS